MRILITIIIVITFSDINGQGNYKSVLNELDNKILERKKYYTKREQKISSLHALLQNSKNLTNSFTISEMLYNEFLPYNLDSSLLYSSKCLEFAIKELNNPLIIKAKLLQAQSLSLLGLYEESKNLLNSINVKQITKKDLIKYYIINISLNRFKNVYSPKIGFLPNYDTIRMAYQDSLLAIIDKNSPKYKVTLADRKKDKKEFKQMKTIMLESLNNLSIFDREYGYTAYTLADAYGKLGDEDNKIKYLAMSSISDIVCGVREYSALREVAFLLLNKEDIKHSNRYIKIAFEDAVFSNAKLRTYEVLKILPLINSKYEKMITRMNRNKTILVIVLILLIIGLFITSYYIFKQKNKLQNSLKNNKIINKKLFDLNNTLEGNNHKMLAYSHTLELLNKSKEEYIAHYLKLSSSYIRKINDYRRMLYRKAKKNGKEDLIKTLRSNEFINYELKLFYKDFDKSFIKLYPNFVKKINDLLKKENQIILKSDEILNTELRIFALIKLGISDSTQIAKFLRYSVTTIYNYRTKMRNRATYSKNEFITKVMNLKV